MSVPHDLACALCAGGALCALGHAQTNTFQTPGQPPPRSGQIDRFSTEFNPAIGLVVDLVGDWTDAPDAGDFDLDFRALELAASAWIDPTAWTYAVVVGNSDELGVEEAAIVYQGFDSNLSLKAGRFFADFGKQMQFHVHDLRTVDRPLVLGSYLGDELAGTGLQADHWVAVGDATIVRGSLGLFAELGGEVEEPEDADPALELESQRRDADEFGLTARLTGFRDVGEHGVLQLGLSARHTPDFAFEYEPSGSSLSGLENTVLGFDATYGWTGETGIERWTLGLEALVQDGDIGALIDDNVLVGDPSDDLLSAIDDTVWGGFAFGDYAWTLNDSAGLELGWFERPEQGSPATTSYIAYYTRHLTELQRLRFSLGWVDEESGDDAVRVALQYTAFVGAHAHGVNF